MIDLMAIAGLCSWVDDVREYEGWISPQEEEKINRMIRSAQFTLDELNAAYNRGLCSNQAYGYLRSRVIH